MRPRGQWPPSRAAAGPQRPQDKIVIYAAEDEKTTEALTKLFTAETGIATEVIRVPAAGTLATRIRAEKAAPKADVFIGGSIEFHEPLADRRPGPSLSTRRSSRRPRSIRSSSARKTTGTAGSWEPSSSSSIPQRFEREVAPKGVAKPKTWDDLLDPAYRKQLVSGAPATCGGAYIFTAVQIFRNGGEAQGFDWLKRYDAQVLQYTPTCPGADHAGRPGRGHRRHDLAG